MFTIAVTSASRPVGVLLGGSGHARIVKSEVAALLKPPSVVSGMSGGASEHRMAGAR